MRKLRLVFWLAVALPAFTQQCAISFRLTAAGSSSAFNNLTRGCTLWTITYNSTGFSALTFTVQTAPNSSGAPGSWSTFTAASGSNPATAITQASATFSGYFPFVRVTLSGLTGSGTVTGLLYGMGTDYAGGSAATTTVAGPDAPGAASTANPVQVAGNDGTNVRAIKTDTAGNSQVVGPGASAAALVGAPVRVGLSDTTNAQNWLTASSLADADTGAGAGAVGVILWNGATFDRLPGNTAGMMIQGPVASTGASTARPILLGGIAEGAATITSISSKTTSGDVGLFTNPGRTFNGDIIPLITDLSGGLMLGTMTGSNADASANAPITFRSSASTEYTLKVYPYGFNGSTWDRLRSSIAGGLQIGGFGSGASPGIQYGMTACDSSAVINVAAAATTELVALTASRSVRVCSFTITADTALSSALFVQGTGTNCGTGTAGLTGAMAMGVASNITVGSGLGELFKTTAGNALCLTAVTGTITGVVSYAKF